MIIDPVTVPRELLEDIRHYLYATNNGPGFTLGRDLDTFLPKGVYAKPSTPTY